jgi:hypothetical protein
MEKDAIEAAVLHAIEVSLEAQLKAVRRLRAVPPEVSPHRKGMSQVDMAYDILKRAGRSLHVTEIIERIEKVHGQRVERDSLVSALAKKVSRGDRFVRSEKNVFGLKGGQ